MTVATLILQRRVSGPRADALLEALQERVPDPERVRWDESGHARLVPSALAVDAREALAATLDRLAEDWRDHICIL